MAGSIQAAQAVADIRAGIAVGEDPEFDQLVKAGERNARGGSGEGSGEGFGDDEGGGQGGQSGQGQQPRQPVMAQQPQDGGGDPLTDLRGPSAYAPAPPLPVGFAEFPVAARGGRSSRTGRRSVSGSGMTITAVQQPGAMRAEIGAPTTGRKDWQAGRDWQAGPRVHGGIDFAGLMPFDAAQRGLSTGIHPDPMERFADAGRRRRSALDMLFERFEGMQGAQASAGPSPAGMRVPVVNTSGLHQGTVSPN